MLFKRINSNPAEVTFSSMTTDKAYTQPLSLTNNTLEKLEITLKPCPTLDRDYEITPSMLVINPGDSKTVQVSVKSAKTGTYRDVIHMITSTFSEKIYVNLKPFEPEISHIQEMVKDRDDQLQSSQSRIERLEEEIEDLNEKLRLAHVALNEKSYVEKELVRVQQENSELKGLLEDLKRNEVYHKQLKEMMNEKVPSLENLISLTIRQEQEKNERKNQKILEILQIKDSLIEDLEAKNEELTDALTLMQHKMNDSKVLLSNTEKSLQNTQNLIQELKAANYEKDQTILAFKSRGHVPADREDSGILKGELLKNFDYIKNLTETLQKFEQENAKLKEREEYVLELSNRQSKIRDDHEKMIKERDLLIAELKSKVQLQTDHIDSLVGKLSQLNYSDILHKLSSLEEENKILSKRLLDSQNSSLTFKKEDLDDNGKILELENENLKLSASVKEFSERSQRLEELVSDKNREIINLQNEIIEYKKFKSEMMVKAAPSPEEDLIKVTSSLRQEQAKLQVVEEENSLLRNKIKGVEMYSKQLENDFDSLYESIESGRFQHQSQNKLIAKINNKLKSLKDKEEQALKAAALAEEGLKVLQFELAQNSTTDVVKELKKLQNELIQIRSKNDVLYSNNLKLKEELEEKKKILTSMQFIVKEDKLKKGKIKHKVPPKLVKALLTAKIGESEAVKKLKKAGKFEEDLKNQLVFKEDLIKHLKSSQDSEGQSELDQTIHKKLVALELELNEIKEQEMSSWQSFKPLSITCAEPPSKSQDDTELLIDGLIYLVDQIAYQDSQDKSETIEKAQRIIIRALSSGINDSEKLAKVSSFAPSREEDRKIWYLELLEQQFSSFTEVVKNLDSVSQRIKKENSPSLSANAGFKGLYLELSKSAKLLTEEINLIYLICKLIRNDCENLPNNSKSKSQNIQQILAEEIEKSLIEKTEEIQELQKENERAKNEISLIQNRLENTLIEWKNSSVVISQLKGKLGKYEKEKEELQNAVETICQELKEEKSLKEQAFMRVDKTHNELKDWQQAQIEILTDRERTIIDLQSQIKALRDQHLDTVQENLTLCKENYENPSQQLLIQELNVLQKENDDLQKKLFELTQNFADERRVFLQKIADLEELSAYQSRSPDGPIKKDPSIQLASLQVLLREKITALDEETRRRIDTENKLRNVLLSESAAEQKILQIEQDLSDEIVKLQRQLEHYEKVSKDLSDERDSAMEKLVQVTEAFKASTEGLRKAEQEIFLLQEEKKSQASKFSSKIKNNDSVKIEMKGKIKEINKVVEGLQKENGALHEHLQSLEKEFEVTSIKLVDSEKINSNLKHKLKEYEQKINDLEEIRNIESHGASSRFEQVRTELRESYEEFQRTIEQYELQIGSLRELILNEFKLKKGKKPLESAELALQISKKDSIIKALRNELKSAKPKKEKIVKFEVSAEEEIISLQNQNFKLKAKNKNLESQLLAARDDLERLSQEAKPVEVPAKKDIQEIEKRHRMDLQKLAEEIARLREKWHSPEEWGQLLAANRELEQSNRRLSEELVRKKDIVENLKAIKDQQDSENTQIQEELEMVKDSSEKLKKMRTELSRKEKLVFDLKSSLESSKENEKKLADENNQNNEKIRSLKAEISRKDAVVKELKTRLESFSQESVKLAAEESESLKEKIKKLKSDCERKDTQIKTFKSKLETAEIELETLQTEKQNLSTDAFANLEKELKKNERIQAQLRKTEAQFQSLCGITRKIFKELADSVEGVKGKAVKSFNEEYYSDCMDILNMDMKDLSEFVGQRSVGTNLCRIERLLEQGEDTGEILRIFSSLLEERLDLERSGAGLKGKNDRSRRIKGN